MREFLPVCRYGLLAGVLALAQVSASVEAPPAFSTLRSCYTGPSPIEFRVTNQTEAKLWVNVAVEAPAGSGWVEVEASLLHPPKGKLVEMTPLGPREFLSLKFNPWAEEPTRIDPPEVFRFRADALQAEERLGPVDSPVFRIRRGSGTCDDGGASNQ